MRTEMRSSTTGTSSRAEDARIGSRATWRHRLRWVFGRRLCFGGLTGALLFACLSLTPSLLPRAAVLQGALTGITGAIGYGLGSAASSALRRVIAREPSPDVKRTAWRVLTGAGVVLLPLFLVLARMWQDEIRVLMQIPGQAPVQVVVTGLIAVVIGYLLLVVARLVRALGRAIVGGLDRVVPRVVSTSIGVVVTAVLVVGVVQGFVLDPAMTALNDAFSVVNDDTSDGVVQPTASQRSGSPDSLVPWDTLGTKGRDFVYKGATAADIEGFTGRPAQQPIRVYVGLRSADTVAERVELAMQELERVGAWDRDVLAVVTTTGTGWVDEHAALPLEYLHDGSTAIVAMQYSYLPSWISFLVDQEEAAAAGRGMISAVHDRWSRLPAASRPQLLLFGESLGSYGTEAAFTDIDEMLASVDGALLVGPVFQNDIHTALTRARAPSSPYWLPVYERGRHVRFASDPASDLTTPAGPWTTPRVVYLQNASDPITWFTPDLLWRRPAWLDQPRGPDVSPSMVYLPVITFWQVASDMAFSTGVPQGHGHVYEANAVDAWAAISPPDQWTETDTQRLRDLVGQLD
jgi:uncharacterized membrane protein